DGAPLAQLATLARMPDEDAAEAVAALGGVSLLGEGEAGGVAFAHPILGRAVYEELEAGERGAAPPAGGGVLPAADAPPPPGAAPRAGRGPARPPRAGRGARGVGRPLRPAPAAARRRGAPPRPAGSLRGALEDPHEPGGRAGVFAELGGGGAGAGEPAAADRL